MPQASASLRAKFPGSDKEALGVLKQNFVWLNPNGIIRKIDPEYQPTQREWDAINYLFHEWDFGYRE